VRIRVGDPRPWFLIPLRFSFFYNRFFFLGDTRKWTYFVCLRSLLYKLVLIYRHGSSWLFIFDNLEFTGVKHTLLPTLPESPRVFDTMLTELPFKTYMFQLQVHQSPRWRQQGNCCVVLQVYGAPLQGDLQDYTPEPWKSASGWHHFPRRKEVFCKILRIFFFITWPSRYVRNNLYRHIRQEPPPQKKTHKGQHIFNTLGTE
jgi:hypothetical protein